MSPFRGSLVALATPMHAGGSLDMEAFRRLVEFHVGSGTQGIVVAGTTGESPCLEPRELETLLEAAIEAAAGRVPVIGGSGTNSTAKTIELTQRVERSGADAALVVTPYYNRPTQEGLYRHYEAVAASTGLPVILYNVPGRTACDLKPETAARLALIGNVVALKEAVPGTERVLRLRELAGDSFVLLSGDDATSMAFMLAGGDGVISVTANVAPRLVRGLCDAARAGETRKAESLNERLDALNQALFLEPNPIPVKWALMRMGLLSEGIRLPLTWLDERHHEAVLEALVRAGAEVAR